MKVHVQLVFELQVSEGDAEAVRSFTHDVRMFAVKASLERLQHLEDTTPKTEENPVNHDEEKKP